MPDHFISPEDRQLFRDAVQGIPSTTNSTTTQSERDISMCPPIQSLEPMGSEHALEFRKLGLQDGKFRKLKQGKIAAQDQCDLHGLTSSDAAQELWQFLNTCVQNHMTCALVIHGKGNGVLKSLTLQLCQQSPWVLAVTSAQNKDGGTGAAYVLLKQQPS